MSVTAIRKDQHDSADPRSALKRAIADAQRAKAACVRQNDAIERAQQLVQAARRKAEAASKAVAAARDEDAAALAEAIITGGTASAQATVRAREAEEASDSVSMARAAYERLERGLKDAEAEATRADKAVNAALATLLEPVALRLLEEVDSLTVRRFKTQAALNTLGRLWDPWTEIRKRIDRTSSFSDAYTRVSIASEKEWQAAIEALKTDSESSLPVLA